MTQGLDSSGPFALVAHVIARTGPPKGKIMGIDCVNCPLRANPLFQDMSPHELAFMRDFKSGEIVVEAGEPILVEGEGSPRLFTALDGMGLRFKTLGDGRRQVLNFVMPGDFLGLQAAVGKEMGHSVEATTRMRLCVFERSDFFSLFANEPSRAYDVTWIAATEEHFLGEALASVGQRSAIERIAWGLVQIFERARLLGMTEGQTLYFPYRQQDLADTLGLSLVHTNKTLAKLRERRLAAWIDRHLTIYDAEGLRKLAMAGRGLLLRERPLM